MGTALKNLRDRMGTITDLYSAVSLLNWDQLTIMPPLGGPLRAHQIESVEIVAHQIFVDPETARLLEAAETETATGEGSEIDHALVRVTRRDYDRATRVPAALVGKLAKASSDGYAVWTKARANDDFAAFLPSLERNIELRLRYIDCFEPAATPYDVLVEDYEFGMTSAEISSVFNGLKPQLKSLVDRVRDHQHLVSDALVLKEYPLQGQDELGRWVLSQLGYDPASWRLDLTVHPFQQSISVDDIRLTTRYNENDVSDALLSTVHEFGHGIYERQIDPALSRTPLAEGCSMTLHESQSRFWENLIGRSPEFAELLHPRFQQIFPKQAKGSSPQDFYKALNKMQPSLIRVEADELTYGFHIIVRYELEREIIEGRMQAKDLPEAWNALYKQYLGVDVPNDRLGVLQDVHWSSGSFGYFPTYFLGSILAAQIWKRMIGDLPNARDLITAGDFAPICDWQREHLHRFGRMYTPKETIELVAGGPLDPAPYVAYMTAKVNSLYGTSL